MNDYNAMSEANAISDLERAEHLNYSGGKGVKRVSVFNDGVQVNVATAEKQDEIIAALGGSSTYTLLVDEASTTVTYVGEAPPGSDSSSAVWRIKKILESGGSTTVSWADGVSSFTKVWDDRASFSYS